MHTLPLTCKEQAHDDTRLSEDAIAATILTAETPTARRQLIAWLPRNHSLYRERSANEIVRIRGFLLQSFSRSGLPEKALPFVLEELETGRNAYLVAGAAIGLRGLSTPRSQLLPFVLKAIANIRVIDDAISFDSYKPQWPLKEYTTGHKELFRTLSWMGAYARPALPRLQELLRDVAISSKALPFLHQAIADIEKDERIVNDNCCNSPFAGTRSMNGRALRKMQARLRDLPLEDQDEQPVAYGTFFAQKPTVVVFFYTRCDNINKCSLTVSRLGQLQNAIREANLESSVRTAAITFDPLYDLPFRTSIYARARGVTTDADNRVFRAKEGTPLLLDYFGSEVNYIGSVVNHHGTELFILNADGSIRKSFVHVQCDLSTVIAELRSALDEPGGIRDKKMTSRLAGLSAPLFSWMMLFLPKCPLCWAAYLSIFGVTNIYWQKMMTRWFLPVVVVLLCVHLWSLYRGAQRRNGDLPFYLSAAGIGCFIGLGLGLSIRPAAYAGFALILSASLLNSLPYAVFMRLQLGMRMQFSKLKTLFHGQSKN